MGVPRWVELVTGPRGRLAVVALFVPLLVAGWIARSHLDEVTSAGQSSFLPASAESTRVVDELTSQSSVGESIPVLIVFARDGGLTGSDKKAIAKIGGGLGGLGITGASQVLDPFSPSLRGLTGGGGAIVRGVGPVSRDGEAAIVALTIDAAERNAVQRGVRDIRNYLSNHEIDGVAVHVTGPAGIAADLERVADQAGKLLLFVTVGLVLVLLLAVYRSPLLALLPLVVVGTGYVIACAIAYLLIKSGLIVVNSEGTMLLLVLIFGAGTDYSLLLVHRYREELESGRDASEALPLALAGTAPAIAASAGTVIAAMLVLLVADLESTRWLGPILAVGIAVMLVSSLTLLPALLSLIGTRAFWPTRELERRPPPRVWSGAAGLVRRRGGTLIVAIVAALAVLACGNLIAHGTIGFGQGETKPTDSSAGNELLDAHFPPGLGSPLTAILSEDLSSRQLKRIENLPDVRLAVPGPPLRDSDRAVAFVVLDGDPYSGAAADAVVRVREELREIDPAAEVGGIPAENLDIETTNERDTKLIVPLVLLVVGLILALVLRALLAPVYLILTVVLSFAATLGLVTFLFTDLFGSEGIAFNLVLLSFIFLVALGVDYNIFLMARAREESAMLGTREGTLSALVTTGGVVTGAGLILAGTFATLTLLPLEELVQIGVTVALGVLIDTFVVRALLVPAITYRLGERAWWPGSAGHAGS
ncbi:MAG: hypothetical protein EDQ89_05665 [Acidobacteria bacterium]|nr:MAG: hypothetical protein EDQ89_05665 [Acidobacteriota bacterium]MCL4286110.1 MMPL family transporter [Thermoleophilia bacterium]